MTQKKTKRSDELIDELLAESGATPEAVFGEGGMFAMLKKRVIERALAGELTHHLGYAKGEAPPEVSSHRNGHSRKTLVSEYGGIEIAVPRDWEGSFESQFIRKGQKRFEGFDETIIAMYARGMKVSEF